MTEEQAAQKAAQSLDDGTIIGASPVTHAYCMLPCRIVLRDLDGHYVVHMQIFARNERPNAIHPILPSYSEGNYFPKNGPNPLRGAWECFDRRVRRLNCWD